MIRKKMEKAALVICLTAGTFCFFVAIALMSQRWGTSAGQLFALAGLFQLEVSGAWRRFMEFYGDTRKFPYGPPSYITRQMGMTDRVSKINMIKGAIIYKPKTALYLVVAGSFVQLIAVWAPNP